MSMPSNSFQLPPSGLVNAKHEFEDAARLAHEGTKGLVEIVPMAIWDTVRVPEWIDRDERFPLAVTFFQHHICEETPITETNLYRAGELNAPCFGLVDGLSFTAHKNSEHLLVNSVFTVQILGKMWVRDIVQNPTLERIESKHFTALAIKLPDIYIPAGGIFSVTLEFPKHSMPDPYLGHIRARLSGQICRFLQ